MCVGGVGWLEYVQGIIGARGSQINLLSWMYTRDTGNQTQIFWNSSPHTCPLSYRSRPKYNFFYKEVWNNIHMI